MNNLIQAAIDAIQEERHEAWEDLKDDPEYRNGYDDGLAESMRILIDDLPSAQPEQRKWGEWINITNDESLDEEYECSVCGYELFYSNPTKFCPNCGANMRGENDEAY